MKTKEQMLKALDIMLDEDKPYPERLEAYEFLEEDCEEAVDDMVAKLYTAEGEGGKMLIEVLSNYKGNKAIFMGLVSYLYGGDDVALYARLIGSYGDEQGIEALKTFVENYEPNYNEYMEIRNAIEELGGDFDLKQDFSDDPFYRYLKGLDEPDTGERIFPFAPPRADEGEGQDDDCDDDCCQDDSDDCCHDDGDCDCCHDENHHHNHNRHGDGCDDDAH